eukprot:15158.XXX_1229320_1231616_1 [CDS] Oithona nana genome sequencing.
MDDTTALIVEGIFLLIIGIFGIIGNVVAIVVFARQHLQKSFHALMLSLSAFDLVYITASILIFSIPQFSDNYKESGIYFYILPWVLPMAQVGLTGSIYFTMAITVERYVTVCHPFYRVSHSWPAKTLVLPLVAFAILYNTPKFFELQVIVPGDDLNGTIAEKYDIAATDLRLNGYYYKIYLMWMNFLLMGLGPFVVLVVLNALSVRELIVLSGGNNITIGPDSATNRRKDIVLAKVSMAIVFVFIVCHSIKWIPNIYELLQVDEEDKEWPNWVELISNFSHLAIVFNSSVNFYIYFAKHWRAILNIPESRASNQTELTRIRTSVVAHNFNHRNSHTYHPSAPAISEQMDKIQPPAPSSKLTVPNGSTNGKTNLDANQTENATEDTRMLVNVIVSAPQDYNNGDVNA